MSNQNVKKNEVAAAKPESTTTVKVSAKDELDVWVVGEGTPVVLVHGLFFYNLLMPLAEELARKGDYQVIWYHRRGYNENTTEPVELAENGRDIVKILDELKIRKAHIVGHSAGANYALALVTEAPDRVLSVALLDFMLANEVESGGMIKEFTRITLAKAMDGDPEGAAKDWLDLIGITRETMERVLPGSWSAMLKDSPTMFKVDLPALDQWSPDPASVKAIEVPVAHLGIGESPPAARETAELLQSWLPKLTVLELSTDDHFFPVTATAESAGVLDNWLKGQNTR